MPYLNQLEGYNLISNQSMVSKKFAKDSTYLTISYMIALFINYIFRIIMSRYFSVSEYGLFYSIFTFITFFLFLLNLGLDQAGIYYIIKARIAKDYEWIKTIIISSCVSRLIAAIIFIGVILLMSSYLERTYFKYPEAGFYLIVLSIYLIFSSINSGNLLVLQGFQKMKSFSFYEPTLNLLNLLLTIGLFWWGAKIMSPFLAYTIASLILIPIFWRMAKKTYNLFEFKIVDFKETTSKLFSYGLPVIISSVSSRIILQIDTLVLTGFVPMSMVGLYQAAVPIITMFSFFSVGILAVLFVEFTAFWHSQELEKVSAYMIIMYKYGFLALLPLIAIIFSFSKEVLYLIFGKDYVPASATLMILLLSVIFNYLSAVNFQSLSAFGKTKTVSKIMVIGGVLSLILNCLLIPKWGIIGAAISAVITYIILFIFSYHKIREIITFKVHMKVYLLPLLFVGVWVAGTFLLKQENYLFLLGSVLLLGIGYLLVLGIFNIVTKEEIKMMISLFKKD